MSHAYITIIDGKQMTTVVDSAGVIVSQKPTHHSQIRKERRSMVYQPENHEPCVSKRGNTQLPISNKKRWV